MCWQFQEYIFILIKNIIFRLEPIIQSEVVREKNINIVYWHIYMESEEMALMNLFSGWQWRHRHREQTYGHGGRRAGRRCMERVIQKFIIPCVKQIASGNLLMTQGTQTGALWQAEGWGGEGDGREFWEGRDTGMPMADSCWCMTENHKILFFFSDFFSCFIVTW